MHYQTLKISLVCFFCSLVTAVIATSVASADEVPIDNNALVDLRTFNNNKVDLALSWPVETGKARTSNLNLPEPRSQLVSFVKKCAELEAVPLFEIAEQEDKHVYLGINFDGFLGVYARL